MGWVVDICSWTSCLMEGKNRSEEAVQSSSKPAETLSEKKMIPDYLVKQFPPSSNIISERPKQQARMNRDIPPIPSIPVVFELGPASPRKGATRSSSRGSTKTTSSTKSRNRQTLVFDGRTKCIRSPIDVRKVEGAMPGKDVAKYRDIELGAETTSQRISTHRPSVISAQEGDGKLKTFSQRSSPLKSYQGTTIACVGDYGEDDDNESLKTLYRRSTSAPIPVRLLSALHTIRRKPVTPKTSISFTHPNSASGSALETSSEQLGTTESPIEMYVPAFELSADPKSRTQSYYADAGAALLAATLDEPPPLPEKLPNLLVDTDFKTMSSTKGSNILDTPLSMNLPFSPLTTVSSPIDDSSVSPITPPRAGRSLDRLIIMKRSKSVGPFSMPLHHSDSLKRRSLEVATPPLPTLPATTYKPTSPKQSYRPNSLTKSESTKRSSRRSSNSSSTSETTSQSSQPSRGPSPSTQQPNLGNTLKQESKLEPEPEPQLELLKPIAFQRRSTNAPIPLTSTTDTNNNTLPPVPTLPPQAYHFFPPQQLPSGPRPNTKSLQRTELVRSTSTENLRSALSQQPPAQFLQRSKSTYQPTTHQSNNSSWTNVRAGNLRPWAHRGKERIPAELSTDPEPEAESEIETDSKPEEDDAAAAAAEQRKGATLMTDPEKRNETVKGRWGKGMGAAWGVAY